MQSSFLTKPMDEPLTTTEVEYCAVDAQLASLIRGPQRAACDRAGILETLDRVVMPWNVTVAEIQWHGVLYDRDKCRLLLDGSARVRERLGTELAHLGVSNPNSAEQLARLLEAAGLGRHFPKTETGRLSTRDNVLEGREHLHPAIPLVRRWRKVRQLASDPAVLGLITGADGRVHAEFNALGADSGRTQARRPNLLGIGRIFRPLIRAPRGLRNRRGRPIADRGRHRRRPLPRHGSGGRLQRGRRLRRHGAADLRRADPARRTRT